MDKVLKAGATLFVVGALLALAAPVLAYGIGMAPSVGAAAAMLGSNASPMWMGVFFGAFGAIDAAVRPIIGQMMGEKPEAAAPAAQASVKTAVALQPEMGQETAYRERLEAERVAEKAAGRGA
jgi:hypothetical protein